MTSRSAYVWNGSAWEAIGVTANPTAAKYQTTAPTNPLVGEVWVDSDSSPTLITIPVPTAQIADGAVTPTKQSGGYAAKTGTYSVVADDRFIECTSGSFTVDLHTAVGYAGVTHTIKNSGTGVITVDPYSTQTIDANSTILLSQYDSLTIASNGTNWMIV